MLEVLLLAVDHLWDSGVLEDVDRHREQICGAARDRKTLRIGTDMLKTMNVSKELFRDQYVRQSMR